MQRGLVHHTCLRACQIASSKFDVKIQSMIEVESDVRVKETYTTVTLGENMLDIPDALKYSRLLYVT